MSLLDNLHSAFKSLVANPCPYVTGPEATKKRASVALIVRVQPNYSHWPPNTPHTPPKDLESFFHQDWVKHGQPEVLFIKRAARKGDRWTSHVALPGGRRDPEDADDQAAAIRETIEEVGIDLSAANAIPVGNLPQRVVTTSWGRVPLMVLCPYVFLLTNPHIAPLRLQPTEVASTHWVPLSALLSADQRTVSYEDVSNRLANQETGVKRWMLRAMLGQMEFAAIRLLPAESLYSTTSPAEGLDRKSELATFYSTPNAVTKLLDRYRKPLPAPQYQPLLLWGLTLGVMADFLDMLPPHNALELWSYPTFTPWDVRFAIWAMSYKFKQQKLADLKSGKEEKMAVPAAEEGLDSMELPSTHDMPTPKKMHSSRYLRRNKSASEPQALHRNSDVGMPGLGSGQRNRNVSSAVGNMLNGYYDLLRKGVAAALIGRSSFLVLLVVWLVVKHRRRQKVLRIA